MHSSNDATQQPSLKYANLFSFPPTQRNSLLDSPATKAKRSTNQSPQLASIVRKAPSISRQGVPRTGKSNLSPSRFILMPCETWIT